MSWVDYLYFYEFLVVYRIGQDVSNEGQDSYFVIISSSTRSFLGVYGFGLHPCVLYLWGVVRTILGS